MKYKVLRVSAINTQLNFAAPFPVLMCILMATMCDDLAVTTLFCLYVIILPFLYSQMQ